MQCRRSRHGCEEAARAGSLWRPLKNPDGFLFNIAADMARQPIARGVTDLDFTPDYPSDLLVGLHVAQKAEAVVGFRIDKYVHIGMWARVVPRIRTEQVKGTHAARSQGGLGLLQSRNDVVAAHGSSYLNGRLLASSGAEIPRFRRGADRPVP